MAGAFGLAPALAADAPGINIQRRQDQQLEQTQSRFGKTPDVLTPAPATTAAAGLRLDETPCFEIRSITWTGGRPFAWLKQRAAEAAGACWGAQSLKRLRDGLNQALLEAGYVTSRVVVPPQNIAEGRLILEFVPGRISAIHFDAKSIGMSIGVKWFPLAVNQSAILDQFDLDQSLENLRRLPGQWNAQLELIPGEEPGLSELVIKQGTGSRWQGSIGLDDSGARATGKYQLTGYLSIDSPLGLYDQLSFTVNNNADAGSETLGSRATGVQWNVPVGYASVFLGYNQSRYKQTVAGFAGPIAYTGDSRNLEGGIGLVPYRGGSYKGLSQFKLFRKISRNFIDDIEIGVQGRDAVGWELSHQHKHYLGNWSLAAQAAVKSSLPERSKNSGILLGLPDWDGHYQVYSASLHAGRAFSWLEQSWRYQTNLRGQYAGKPVPSSEYLSVGGRYSVRGFDGEHALASGSGGYWRNELNLALPHDFETYLALDAGRIAGEESAGLKQKHLIGTAVGLRGHIGRTTFDLSLGWPLAKPESFTTRRPAAAATISIDLNG